MEYLLQSDPDSILIAVDDDKLYPPTFVQDLYDSVTKLGWDRTAGIPLTARISYPID